MNVPQPGTEVGVPAGVSGVAAGTPAVVQRVAVELVGDGALGWAELLVEGRLRIVVGLSALAPTAELRSGDRVTVTLARRQAAELLEALDVARTMLNCHPYTERLEGLAGAIVHAVRGA